MRTRFYILIAIFLMVAFFTLQQYNWMNHAKHETGLAQDSGIFRFSSNTQSTSSEQSFLDEKVMITKDGKSKKVQLDFHF